MPLLFPLLWILKFFFHSTANSEGTTSDKAIYLFIVVPAMLMGIFMAPIILFIWLTGGISC